MSFLWTLSARNKARWPRSSASAWPASKRRAARRNGPPRKTASVTAERRSSVRPTRQSAGAKKPHTRHIVANGPSRTAGGDFGRQTVDLDQGASHQLLDRAALLRRAAQHCRQAWFAARTPRRRNRRSATAQHQPLLRLAAVRA